MPQPQHEKTDCHSDLKCQHNHIEEQMQCSDITHIPWGQILFHNLKLDPNWSLEYFKCCRIDKLGSKAIKVWFSVQDDCLNHEQRDEWNQFVSRMASIVALHLLTKTFV